MDNVHIMSTSPPGEDDISGGTTKRHPPGTFTLNYIRVSELRPTRIFAPGTDVLVFTFV